jgi:hypothetical protein
MFHRQRTIRGQHDAACGNATTLPHGAIAGGLINCGGGALRLRQVLRMRRHWASCGGCGGS